MLGVLAVIGVLTVGSIAGYRFALDKYHANELVNGVGAMAMSVSSQIMETADISLDEFREVRVIPYEYDYQLYDDNIFSIVVSDVPAGVCRQVKTMKWSEPKKININDVAAGECNLDLNAMEFVFGPDVDCACGYCQHCEEETCVADEVCDNGCPGDYPVELQNGSCRACPSKKSIGSLEFAAKDASECGKCGPEYVYSASKKKCIIEDCKGVGYWQYDKDTCLSCEGNWDWHSQPDSVLKACIEACPNRVIATDRGWGKSCALPKSECDFVDSWGNCKQCDDNLTQYWGDCSAQKCPGITFSRYDYWDQCVIDCPNYGENVGRCCSDEEVYTHLGTKYGHPYGACCPKTRPMWMGSQCEQDTRCLEGEVWINWKYD